MTKATMDLITLTIEGSSIDDGHVRLSDFIEELEALKEALRQTERSLFSPDHPQLYYRIVDASHSSPLRLVVQAVPIRADRVTQKHARGIVKAFTGSVREIKRKRRPKSFDLPALESYLDLGSTLGKHVQRILISDNAGKVIPIDSAFKENIAEVIGPDEFALGSISGKLERLNVHNTSRFEIFPTVGPRKIVCNFNESQLEEVKDAVKRYVTVTVKVFIGVAAEKSGWRGNILRPPR